MTEHVDELLNRRKAHLENALGRKLEVRRPEGVPPLSEREWTHLREEAEDLYWNELEWENVTQEESSLEGEAMPEMAFPGFLAFMRGLLLEETMPDALAEAAPRPEVVEAVLGFLAGRTLELREALESGDDGERERVEAEHAMTSQLIDVVLGQLYSLSPREQKEVLAGAEGRAGGAEEG